MKVFYELKFYYYTLKYNEKTGLFDKHVTPDYFYNMMSANINDYVDMDSDDENSKEAVKLYNTVVEILGDKFSQSENLANLKITDLEIFLLIMKKELLLSKVFLLKNLLLLVEQHIQKVTLLLPKL